MSATSSPTGSVQMSPEEIAHFAKLKESGHKAVDAATPAVKIAFKTVLDASVLASTKKPAVVLAAQPITDYSADQSATSTNKAGKKAINASVDSSTTPGTLLNRVFGPSPSNSST